MPARPDHADEVPVARAPASGGAAHPAGHRRRRPLRTFVVAGTLALLVAACGNEVSPSVSPAPTQATTTTAPPVYWPLTGVVASGVPETTQSALVAKIDNSGAARPMVGINQADLVYEVWVEGITRFASVFHSDVPDRVGPVRSARSTDVDLVSNLGTPLLVWSGGNANVVREVNTAAGEGLLVNTGYDVATGDYWRDGNRVGPHNLFANLQAIRAGYGLDGSASPVPLFTYRKEGAEPTGEAAAGVSVTFGPGSIVQYVWDAERGCALRFQGGPFLDDAGEQVCPRNVVILLTPYGPSTADARSPQAYTIGSRAGLVLSAGRVEPVLWNRPSAADGPNLTNAFGVPIELTPGATWVGLPPDDQVAGPLDAVTAAALLGR
jgi:hypothetical protein